MRLLLWAVALLLHPSASAAKSMRAYRSRFGHGSLTQVHHVIPREHRNHRTLKLANFSVSSRSNVVFLPTAAGKQRLSLHADRPCHEHGHARYNAHVRKLLDDIDPGELHATLCSLKQSMRHLDVPWR